MYDKLTPLSHCALGGQTSARHAPVANHDGTVIDTARFHLDVKVYSEIFSRQNAEHFALYYEQAYPFCVSLFALLHNEKQVWIAGNNTPAIAEQLTRQGCLLIGDWQGKEISVTCNQSSSIELTPLKSNKAHITVFTSGSGGQAKAINKTLQQFQSEIENLEQCWGQRLGDAQVFGTVSHQHIYGLLFRVLWPLAAGRCFHSEMYLSPEPLLNASKDLSAYWVASPAQLKRLDNLTPWIELAKLRLVFSSGGALSLETAKQIVQRCGHKILEVYGSSETGGIAWRQSVDDELWQLFDGLSISVDEKGECYLSSPYLAEQKSIKLDDKIQLIDAGRFTLLGRVDRIVKVEEKRLSLDSLENRLNHSDWVQQSHTLLLADKRDKIAAVLVLTAQGQAFIDQQGRGALIKQLRKELMCEFETVVLPRKWLFINSIPITIQGKINQALLGQLYSLKKTHYPQILSCDFQSESVELQFRVLPDLVYFSGHFPEQPILPGVTQLAWVEAYGKLFFNIELPFLRMEVIKFRKIIQPDEFIKMKLNWKVATGKLYFELTSVNDSHSSGRMVYGEQI